MTIAVTRSTHRDDRDEGVQALATPAPARRGRLATTSNTDASIEVMSSPRRPRWADEHHGDDDPDDVALTAAYVIGAGDPEHRAHPRRATGGVSGCATTLMVRSVKPRPATVVTQIA